MGSGSLIRLVRADEIRSLCVQSYENKIILTWRFSTTGKKRKEKKKSQKTYKEEQ